MKMLSEQTYRRMLHELEQWRAQLKMELTISHADYKEEHLLRVNKLIDTAKSEAGE